MCCQPDHLGPLPEWAREYAGEVLAEGPAPRGVDARTLAVWLEFMGRAVPHAPLSSTEGGRGRALPRREAIFEMIADPGELTGWDPWKGR